MSANIRPAGVFDTTYQDDIALNRTRGDKLVAYGGFILLLLFPILVPVLRQILLAIEIPIITPILSALLSERTVMDIALIAIAVQGLNILIGFTGQISLGHAAFMGVGAYSAAILVRNLGFSFWVALPTATLITGIVGLLFGLPSLRVKGFYLAMATLAAQFIIPWVLRYPMEPVTNGARPLSVPVPLIGPFGAYRSDTIEGDEPLSLTIEGGDPYLVDIIRVDVTSSGDELADVKIAIGDGTELRAGEMTVITNADGDTVGLEYMASKKDTYTVMATPTETSGSVTLRVGVSRALSFASDTTMYYLIIPLSVLLMLLARNIIRTRVGRAFISIRDNDLAAELLGINVFNYKLQAFFLSSVYAGIAGALFAFETNSLALANFQLDSSIEFLAMLVIGGAGFPLGAVFGVAFFNIVERVIVPSLREPMINILPGLLPFVDGVNIQSAVNPTLFGFILLVFLILEPRGLAYRWEILKIAWKIRPFSQT